MQREQPWVQWRAAETARRLRALRQLSLVLVVPVKVLTVTMCERSL